jgi:hypothetical protein
MHQNTANNQGKPWMRRALTAVAALVITTVPALGFTTLVPGILSPEVASGDANAETDAAISNGPLTFDAPTVMLYRSKEPDQPVQENAQANADVKVLSDWKYTQSFRDEILAILAFDRQIADALSFGNPTLAHLIYVQIVQGQIVEVTQAVQAFNKSNPQLVPLEKFLLLEYYFNYLQHRKRHSPHR